MKNLKYNEQNTSVARIALYYTISNVFVKGMVFLSTPIFTRMMSRTEYGKFSNFTSWENIIYIIATLSLYSAIARAKYDFEDSMPQYVCSTMLTSNIATLLVWGIVEKNKDFFVNFFSIEITYIRLLFLLIMFKPSFDFLMRWYRSIQKYRFVVAVSVILSVLQILIGIVFVILSEDKYVGRVRGYIFSSLIIYIFLWFYIVWHGRCLQLQHVKYALGMSVPLIFHSLSNVILVSADRVMITSQCGSADTALYVLPYNVSQILSVIWNSMEQAWAPWLYDQLNTGHIQEIREASKKYTALFSFIVIGALLLGPEAVLILGGREYYETRFMIPPVMMAFVFQFLYAFYVDIEFYLKKTVYISEGTVIAALMNLVLNQVLIGRYGYIAAAYTTLLGYMVMFVFHCINVYRLKKYTKAYDLRYFGIVIIVMAAICVSTMFLYSFNVLRYVCLIIYMCIMFGGIIKYRNVLMARH